MRDIMWVVGYKAARSRQNVCHRFFGWCCFFAVMPWPSDLISFYGCGFGEKRYQLRQSENGQLVCCHGFGQTPSTGLPTVQFSSAQDGIYALGKAHMRSAPSFRSFANVAFETVPMFVWLTMALSRPFKEDRLELPLSTPLLQVIYDVMSLALCQQVVLSHALSHPGLPSLISLRFLWT